MGSPCLILLCGWIRVYLIHAFRVNDRTTSNCFVRGFFILSTRRVRERLTDGRFRSLHRYLQTRQLREVRSLTLRRRTRRTTTRTGRVRLQRLRFRETKQRRRTRRLTRRILLRAKFLRFLRSIRSPRNRRGNCFLSHYHYSIY